MPPTPTPAFPPPRGSSRSRIPWPWIAAALWLLALTPSQADRVVRQYEAGLAGNPATAPSPSTQGWTAGTPASDTANFTSAPVSPDGSTGFNAWRLLDNSTAGSQFLSWTGSVSASDHAAATAQGWTLAARLRVADPVAANAGGRSVMLLYGNGTRRWGLFFDLDPDGTLVASFSSGSTTLRLEDLDPAQHHEHQLIHDAATNTTRYLVNGVLRHSTYNGESNSFNGVQWGTGSSGGRGDGYWNEVAFAIADPTGTGPSGPRPGVVTHPVSQAIAENGAVTLHAAFSGSVTAYQWFKDSLPLPGSTTATLPLDPLSPADAGDYWCRAFNGPDAFTDTATAAIAVLQAGAGLRITEFLASNTGDLRDEDGEAGDWIELFNAGSTPLSTAGWHLTDNPAQPQKWPLPPVTLAPGGFRLVWATGKDRRSPESPWHANFSLAREGGYLVLTRPDGSAASSFAYPAQADDVSHGIGAGPPAAPRHFFPATPGALNLDGRAAATAAIAFNPPAGTFDTSVAVAASSTGGPPSGTLRFTTDGSRPDFSSPELLGPVTLTGNTQLRVAVIAPGERYGISATAAYLRRGSDLATFSSPLPLVILSNFGGGEVPGVSSRGPNGDGSEVVQVAMQPQVLTLLDGPPGSPVNLSSPVAGQTRAGLRRRGSSSFTFTRRSYRMDTWQEIDGRDLKTGLLDLPAESDWVLYAPDPAQFDITLLHNAFSYELARQSGFNAPRFRFVELFLDTDGDGGITLADHKGLYLLVETPKRDKSRVPFDVLSDDASRGGWMINVDRMDALPPGSAAGSLQPRQFHSAGPDRILQTSDDIARGVSTSDDMPNFYHSFFNFVSPRGWDIQPAQRTAIQTALRDFDAALYSPDYQDPALGWAPHIDARNWAHHLALHQLSRNQDAIVLSAYLYRESPGTPIRWASIWDFDRSYARMGSATANLNWAHDRLFYPRLLTDPEFRQTHIDTWQDLRRGAFATANMQALIDAQAAEITSTVAARSGITASTWSTNLTTLKSWLATRAAAIDAQYTAPPVFTSPGGPVSPGLTLSMSAPAGSIRFTTDGSDPRLPGGGVSPTAQTYGGPLAIGAPMTVTARALNGGAWSGITRAAFYPASTGPRLLRGGDATWNLNGNWESPVFPDGPGQAAIIGRPNVANRSVTLSAPVTIGSLLFDDQNSPFRNRLAAAAPRALAFDSGTAAPARLAVTGSGTGFIEFDLAAGVILQSPLEIDVANLAGDPGHGALRLRQSWTGPGGITKLGPGTASLTGEGKLYQGPTVIGEGVLRVTSTATPSATASVSVLPGGQLRLVSGGTPLYPFGGTLVLQGTGRGAAIPDDAGFGKLGALRYDPGSSGNHATLASPLLFPTPAQLHVADAANRLDLTGPLGGAGGFRKSGGGTLGIAGNHGSFDAPLFLDNGTLHLRGELASPVTTTAGSILDAAGSIGPVTGGGLLKIDRARLASPAVSGVALAIVIPAADPESALLVTDALTAPAGVALYLDLPAPPPATNRLRGGLLLPAAAPWSALLAHPALHIFIPDPAGLHLFEGRLWSPHPTARVTRVPSSLTDPPGRVLEIRFDGAPLDYDSWRLATFPNPADPALAGPDASPFGDGIANLLRFALGTTPDGRVRLPELLVEGGVARFRFPYDPALHGLRWIVESTADPAVWPPSGILFDSRHDLSVPDASGWISLETPATPAARFFRLRVELGE